MARQNAYANGILFEVAPQLKLEELAAAKSPSHDSAYQLLVHLLAAEANYFAQIRGEGRRKLNEVSSTSLAELASLATEHNGKFREFVTALADEDLAHEVNFEFSTGARLVYPVWQLLTQTYFHSAQHRGELSILLSELGRPLPIHDIIVRLTEESGQPWPFKAR